jgi:hypothetical protein
LSHLAPASTGHRVVVHETIEIVKLDSNIISPGQIQTKWDEINPIKNQKIDAREYLVSMPWKEKFDERKLRGG